MQSITSRDNDKVKLARRLATAAAARAQHGLFYAEGLRLCLDLAQSLRPAMAFFTQRQLEACPQLEGLAEENYLVADHVAEKLADTKSPQGVVCLFPLPAQGLGHLRTRDGIILCEAVADAVNVGAIIRTAAGLGLGGVILTPGCADPFGPRALRAAMGAAARLPVVCNVPVDTAADTLHAAGATLYAAALQGGAALGGTAVQRPFCLMLGNEGAGLSPAALNAADQRVYIPMKNGVESLNVAAAAAVFTGYFTIQGSG